MHQGTVRCCTEVTAYIRKKAAGLKYSRWLLLLFQLLPWSLSAASAETGNSKMAIFIPSIYLDNERLLKSGTHSLQFVSVKHATVLLSIGHVWTDAGKQFQLIEMVLVDRKLANRMPIYMKDQKEDGGNCRLVSLTSFSDRWDHGTDRP